MKLLGDWTLNEIKAVCGKNDKCCTCILYTGVEDDGPKKRCQARQAIESSAAPVCWEAWQLAEPVVELTITERELCRLTEARYLSRDTGQDRVVLWSGEPRDTVTVFGERHFSDPEDALELGTVSAALFPSVPEGKLVEVPCEQQPVV